MEKHIAKIIGVLFGIALIVTGIARPKFMWNHEAVSSIRFTLGDTLTTIFLIGAGIVLAISALLFTRKA